MYRRAGAAVGRPVKAITVVLGREDGSLAWGTGIGDEGNYTDVAVWLAI